MKVFRALLFIAVMASGCVKPYLPPPAAENVNILVVDANIAIGSQMQVKLSRTKNMSDTVPTAPESDAAVQLESESGSVFIFSMAEAGIYVGEGASALDKYRLRIKTKDGNEYLSDFVQTKVSPPIDNIEWKEDDDIFIYVSSHDEQGSTRYYRWEFEETVEYHAVYDSNIEYRNGELIFITPEEMRFACFKYYSSSDVLISTSENLQDDVISWFPLTRIPNDNSRINYRYSILVKQYAMSAEAYKFWQTLKQNNEQAGNIFDPQPSQLYGNIKNVDNPGSQVVGFLNVTTTSEKRLFISQTELSVINYPNNEFCKEFFVQPAQAGEWLTSGTYMGAYYRMSDGALAVAPSECVDCRLSGGSTAKPAYW